MIEERNDVREDLIKRLNRIEGQVRGIRKMVESERRCVEVMRQVSATDAALRAVAKLIVSRHLDLCLNEAMDDPEARKHLFKDVLESFGRFG